MEGIRTVLVILFLLAPSAVAFASVPQAPNPPQAAALRWWFDPARGTICWDGRRPAPNWWGDFVVDLDGNNLTSISSMFLWAPGIGNYTQHMTWERDGGSTILDETRTRESFISQSTIFPPYPHVRFSVRGNESEWFHLFVTKRVPPTDWILGVSDDDGTNGLPITRPFWTTVDFGKTWTEYDPLHYGGPTGNCAEDRATLRATIDFDPDTLNPNSHGRWVTAYIELPLGYDPQDINATTVRLKDTLAPFLDSSYGFVTDPGGYIVDHDRDGIQERMVKFDRAAVIALLKPGTYSLQVTGALSSGTRFEGLSDAIRVLDLSR